MVNGTYLVPRGVHELVALPADADVYCRRTGVSSRGRLDYCTRPAIYEVGRDAVPLCAEHTWEAVERASC